ncbi:hypothetical protein MJC1_03487 [Methylocystis sp. MJC1]|nr:hypothetical protein MJC1_03487 [Methylocystis sp. MJC1]
MAADRVDFVDEDDARRVLLGLLEHVAHAAGADADEHFDEVGAGDREEGHARFAGDGAGEQRLTRAGRADEQHAARNAPAEPLELARIAQEFDDFLQVFLGLVDAGDVLEGDAALRLGEELGLRLAKAHGPAARPALHLTRHIDPHADEEQQRQTVHDERREPARIVARWLGADLHLLGFELLHQRRVIRRIGREAAIVAEMAGDFIARDHDVMDAAFIDLHKQLAEGNLARRGASLLLLEHGKQNARDCDEDDPRQIFLPIRLHFHLLGRDPLNLGRLSRLTALRQRAWPSPA